MHSLTKYVKCTSHETKTREPEFHDYCRGTAVLQISSAGISCCDEDAYEVM